MLELRLMDETQIRLLYDQSLSRDFPPSELKSLSAILHMYCRKEYDVLAAYDHDAFIGYALVYCPRDQRLALLDYFAVEPAYRRQGLGGTILHGHGAYTGNRKNILMCAARPGKIGHIKAAVSEEDPEKAFIIVCDAREVFGEGFGEYGSDSL